MPPIEVDTAAAKKAAKRKPASEPQVPVTKEPGAAPDEPVIFSANRTPTDYAKVGSSVSVITEKEIDSQSKTFLQDYLQQVPGVNISTTGGVGKTTTFMLRGLGQRYVKVLVDGMDLSDPTSTQTQTSFEHLLVGDVAQIEVLKGSQSTLYGGDAVAGVISVDSIAATRPGLFQSGSAEYGSYNTWRGAYSAGYADTDGSNVAFTVQGLDTDGFSAARYGTEDDGYRNITLSGRGELKISDSVSVFFAGRGYEARNDYDTSSGTDAYFTSDASLHAGRLGANVSLFEGTFLNTIAIQGMQVQRDNYDSYPAWFDGDRVKAEYRGVLSFSKQLALVAGADWERNGATTNQVSRKEVEVTSPYAQMIVEPLTGLVLTAGARIDNHSAFGAYDTHRFTAAYQLPSETRFHASYGTGFRAPSLNELYGPYGANPDLHPETSESWDAGVEQRFLNDTVGIGITYFSVDVTDLISYTTGYVQVPGVTESSGVELTGFAKLSSNLMVNAGYTYTDSRNPNDTRAIRVPRHSLALGLTAQPTDKLSVNVTGLYVADVLDSDFSSWPSSDVPIDDYFLLSAKVGYEVLPGTIAYVRGENLLDEDYTTVINYNNPGVSVYGGVQFALP